MTLYHFALETDADLTPEQLEQILDAGFGRFGRAAATIRVVDRPSVLIYSDTFVEFTHRDGAGERTDATPSGVQTNVDGLQVVWADDAGVGDGQDYDTVRDWARNLKREARKLPEPLEGSLWEAVNERVIPTMPDYATLDQLMDEVTTKGFENTTGGYLAELLQSDRPA